MNNEAIIKAGVIGYPVKHSLSPVIHNYWLKKYGIRGEYNLYEVTPEELEDFIISLAKQNISGVNVTIPHKERVFEIVKNRTRPAEKIGAVNTIFFDGGILVVDNTDHLGFWLNVGPYLKARNKAVVIGAGGASASVIHALLENNFDNVMITNRTREKADFLANKFGERVEACDWEHRNDILSDADFLVNTTSLGMTNQPDIDISLKKLPPDCVVNDIVYNPLETKLLAIAKNRGNITVDGLGMLLYQAAPGFKHWFDRNNKYIPKTKSNPEGLPEITEELRTKLQSGFI